MKYSAVLFKADQNPDLCAEYCTKHAAVLTDYGCDLIIGGKHDWIYNPHVYVIAMYDHTGKMVSGIRLHLYHKAFPLPVETAVVAHDKSITSIIKNLSHNVTAEMCGLWTAKSLRNKGFGPVMTGAGIAAACRLGVKSLFGFAAPHTYNMFSEFGYIRVSQTGRNGDFLYPTADYISTVVVIPDLSILENASPLNRSKIISLRENPCQTITEDRSNSFTVAYNLEQNNSCLPYLTKNSLALQQL